MVQVVQERNNILDFPSKIPQKRQFRECLFKLIWTVLLLSISVYLTRTPKMENLYILGTVSMSIFVFHELIFRTLSLIEECHHLESRYKNSKRQLLSWAYEFNDMSSRVVYVTVFSFIYLVYFYQNISEVLQNNVFPLLCLVLVALMYRDIIKLNECSMNIARSLDDSLGLDYGSGMAHSYFEGYLNIILPNFGDERKGLVEMIEDYESKHGVDFGNKTIYLLIPLSGKCPPKVSEQSRIAEDAGKLESRKIHRAGTQNRVYHASVYKLIVKPDERPIYVCAEYATPLTTLNEVMGRNSTEAVRYKKHYPELVTNFYMTLRKLVKNSYQHCELIYYNDIDEEGHLLHDLDVGRLILERMNTQRT